MIGEVLFGPSFNLGRFGLENARLGVYGIAGAVRLDNNLYTTTLGAGARFNKKIGGRINSLTRFEIRRRLPILQRGERLLSARHSRPQRTNDEQRRTTTG